MKTFSVLLLMAMLAGSNLFKSADDDFSSQELTKASVITCATVDTVIVPVTLRTSFDTKYPKASKVMWYSYTPDKTQTVDPTAWYYGLDDKDYYVTFNWDDADYIAWYDNGNWIRSSKTVDNIDLPADVMRSINTQYPGFRIADVDMEKDDKQELYEVKLVKGDTKWNVHYLANGTVARKKERHLTKNDPQADMTADFTTRFPNSTEVVWYRYTPEDRTDLYPTDWDYNMDASDYEVRFKMNGTEHSAWYDNGKWVRSEAVLMGNTSTLPANITDMLKTQYAGYTVKDVETEQNTNRTIYEIELTKGNEKCKVHYTSEGAIIKKKCRTA